VNERGVTVMVVLSCLIIVIVYAYSFFLPAWEDPYPGPGNHVHTGGEAFCYWFTSEDPGGLTGRGVALLLWCPNLCLWAGLASMIRGWHGAAFGLGCLGFLAALLTLPGCVVYDYDPAEELVGYWVWLSCPALLSGAALVARSLVCPQPPLDPTRLPRW
jgi:hypothetical protein